MRPTLFSPQRACTITVPTRGLWYVLLVGALLCALPWQAQAADTAPGAAPARPLSKEEAKQQAWTAYGASLPPSALLPATAHGQREVWSGKLYSSTYRAGVCLGEDGGLRGVLYLRTSSGQVDTYHFIGRHDQGRVLARHHSGHEFQGQLDNNTEVSGTIILSNGFKIKLTGQREAQAQLTENCGPLLP